MAVTQMDREGLALRAAGQLFSLLADYERAQELLHVQLEVNWPAVIARGGR